MDPELHNLKGHTLFHSCNICCFLTTDKAMFKEHLQNCAPRPKKIDQEEYIKLRHEITSLKMQLENSEYLRKELAIRNNTLESIIKLFHMNTGNYNQNDENQPVPIDNYAQPVSVPEHYPPIESSETTVPVSETTVPETTVVVSEVASEGDNQSSIEPGGEISQDDSKKSRFRPLVKSKGIEFREEYTEEELAEKYTHIIEKERDQNEADELYSFTELQCKERISELVNYIRTSTTYNRELLELKNLRLKLIQFLNYTDHVEFLTNHIEIMKDVLSSRMDTKKVNGVIKSKVLLPIELRWIDYKGYELTVMDTNEISSVKTYLRNRHGFGQKFMKFSTEKIIELYNTYNISLFNIIDYIKIILPSKFGINNLIYLSLPKSTSDDPYSFYYLDEITLNSKDVSCRNWSMDCRLDEFTADLSRVVLEYCISLYRKLHDKIYHDNVYRGVPDGTSQILEYEGEQLIQNIVILSDYHNFNLRIREIIKEKCSYIPTKNDKFNLRADDPIIRRRFTDLLRAPTRIVISDNIKRLFDTITVEQLDDLVTSKMMS